MTGKFIVIFVFLILLVLFLILNSRPTQVDFIFVKAHVSTAIIIFVSAIIGFIIGSAIAYVGRKPSKPQKNEKKV